MPDVREVGNAVSYYASALFQHLQRKDVFLWSQAIAFKALVSVIPLLVIGVGLFGSTLAQVVHDLLPAGQGSDLLSFAEQLQAARDTITLVGAIGLILAGITLFSTLRAVMANVFAAEWHTHRSILGGYVFDLRMAGQIGVLFILTLGISASLQALNVSGSGLLERFGLDFLWLNTGWWFLVQSIGYLVPVLITTVIFFQLYYLTPLPHPPRRSVAFGALFAAILFEASKFAFAVYASRFGSFERYSAPDEPAGLGGIGGAFGMIIAFVFWAYYSGLVLILGALMVLLHESRVRDGATLPDSDMAQEPSAGE